MIVAATGVAPSFAIVTPAGVTFAHVVAWSVDEKSKKPAPVLYPDPPKDALILRDIPGGSQWCDIKTGRLFASPVAAVEEVRNAE